MSLLAIFIIALGVVIIALAVLRFIGSRLPQSDDPAAAEAIAMADADRRREAARRPTGGTGM